MKKFTILILHLSFAVFALIGIGLMFSNSNYGRGLSWLTTESFEDSSLFQEQFQSDIRCIFDYVNYRDVFETNGELDFNKKIASISYMSLNTSETTYTLDELIRYAKAQGYYLDDDYQVQTVPIDDKIPSPDVRINWKAYQPVEILTEPADAIMSLADLSKEALTCLGNYYKVSNNLIGQPSNLYFQIYYQHTETDTSLFTNIPDLSVDQLKALGEYCYVSGSSLIVDSNFNIPPAGMSAMAESSNPYDNNNYYAIIALDTEYTQNDIYQDLEQVFYRAKIMYAAGVLCLFIGLAGCLITLYQIIHSITGRTLYYLDKITFENSLILCAICTVLALYVGDKVICKLLHTLFSIPHWNYIDMAVQTSIIYIFCLIEGLSIIRRYKAHTLWSNSMFRSFRKIASLYFLRKKFTIRLAVIYSLFLLTNLLLFGGIFIAAITSEGALGMSLSAVLGILLFLLDFWAFHNLFHSCWEHDKINEAIIGIADGNTSYQIDLELFTGKEKVLAQRINNIGMGLESALNEQVKSERLKADLITNVSHDIKTPLTSIINYVDLIKREKIQDPKIQSYLDILEQKSQRLKNLTEDLVEASKASSGNLKLEISDIDLVQLVQQTNGEFEEKFDSRHLELVTKIPETSIIIEADGRRLWRVLENLYNNTFKYAMENSRVYVDIEVSSDNSQVFFTIKNVSASPLNISPDELTERFVRGDVARTTEGSGLGLSIAQSLTQLQGGTFEIIIDGDLFKVHISFPIKHESDKAKYQEI